MKKTLLFMFAFMAFVTSALAEDTTVQWTANTDWTETPLSYTQAPYTITMDQADGKTAPAVNASKNDARAYAKNTIVVNTTGENMTKIVFNISSQGKRRLTNVTTTSGSVVVDNKAWTVTWTGSSKEVTFTVGEKADYGTDGNTKAGQLCYDNLVISTGEGGGTVTPDPKPEEPELNTVFDELFNTSLGDFTVENKVIDPSLQHIWSYDSRYTCAKASAYKGTATASESWLISPVIDLSKATESNLTFEEAGNHFNTAENFRNCCQVKVRVDNGEWADVAVTSKATGVSFSFVPAQASLKAYDGKKIQLAFIYTSTTEAAGTWELKNLSVKAKLSEAPITVAAPVFKPAAGTYMDEVLVSISATEGHKIYYTLDGKEPTTASTLYTAPFKLTENTTVIAMAVDAQGNTSNNTLANYNIKESPKVPENSALFNFNKNKWNMPVSNNDTTYQITDPIIENGITLTSTNGSTPTRMWNDFNNGLQLRCYEGGSLTLTATDSKIQKIEFNVSKSGLQTTTGTLDKNVWTGSESSVTFNVTETTNINYIIVTLDKNTGIEGVEANNNGKVIIYSLDGRRLNKAVKGINIINGKKVLVK